MVTDPWAWGRGSAALCCCGCQVGTAGQAEDALVRGACPCGGGAVVGASGLKGGRRWCVLGWAPGS